MRTQRYIIRVRHKKSGDEWYVSHFALFNATGNDRPLTSQFGIAVCVSDMFALHFGRKYLADALCKLAKGFYVGCDVDVIDILKRRISRG